MKNLPAEIANSDRMGLSVSTKSCSLEQQTNSPSPYTIESQTSTKTQQNIELHQQHILPHYAESYTQNCSIGDMNRNALNLQSQMLKNTQVRKLSFSSYKNTDGLLKQN